MKFDDVARVVPSLFDIAFLRQAFDVPPERDDYLLLQIHRWVESGKLNRLRNGLYELAENPPNVLEVANRLVEPSYVTGPWVLSYFGIIPDAVMEIGSATSGRPFRKSIENHHGRFTYREMPVFMGFDKVAVNDDVSCYMASPEKALVDTWFFGAGEWTRERHFEARYQNLALISPSLVGQWAEACQKPRMRRAAEAFCDVAEEIIQEEEDMRTIEEEEDSHAGCKVG